jgi:hypothetical protein
MSKLNDFKALFLGVHCPDMRCKGSTTALISIMLANPKAIMIVHTAHVGDYYSKQYGIDRTRFFSVRNGVLEFIGRRIEGPILVDLPAIADVLEQVRMEQAEIENRDEVLKRQKDEIKFLQKQNETLQFQIVAFQKVLQKDAITHNNRITQLTEEIEKKDLFSQHLRNRNAQLLGAFSKIDAVLAEKLIDPIPEDSL